jgi:protein gp37
MGDKSGIQWTDATWNPVTGCDKVSPGCAHCYAETVAARFWPKQYPPVQLPTGDPSDPLNVRPRAFTDVQCHQDRLDQPLRWRRPRRIFVNSMSDLFHEAVPDAFIDKVFAVMALAPQHTFQVLTKRAERMRWYLKHVLPDVIAGAHPKAINAAFRLPLPNVWLGVSVENQRFADERIPLLLSTPAAVRFLSCEPLLSHLNLIQFLSANYISVGGRQWIGAGGIGWVIVGGESGKDARPFDLAWAESIVRQCKDAGVPVFVKQLGSYPTNGATYVRGEVRPRGVDGTYRRIMLRDSHGGDPSEWPEDLRVRQFPEVASC